jgi:hypothetical protein
VRTTLGNINTALAGTYHRGTWKQAQRYFASLAWRFNRRYQLDTMAEWPIRGRPAAEPPLHLSA